MTTAQPTPGTADLITAAHQSGRTVTIVSNNSGHAISQYLAAHNLSARVIRIIGRDDSDPDRMKPSPYRVREAVATLDAQPGECAFIGDSPSDVLAGRLAGVAIIGYANKPGKADQLTHAGADAVTTDLAEITTALRAAPGTALPNSAVLRSSGAAARRRVRRSPRQALALARPARRARAVPAERHQ